MVVQSGGTTNEDPILAGVCLAAHLGLLAGNHVYGDPRERKGEYFQGNVIWTMSCVSSAGLESESGKGAAAFQRG